MTCSELCRCIDCQNVVVSVEVEMDVWDSDGLDGGEMDHEDNGF